MLSALPAGALSLPLPTPVGGLLWPPVLLRVYKLIRQNLPQDSEPVQDRTYHGLNQNHGDGAGLYPASPIFLIDFQAQDSQLLPVFLSEQFIIYIYFLCVYGGGRVCS